MDPFGNYAQGLVTAVFTFLYGVAGLMCVWVLVNACIISEVGFFSFSLFLGDLDLEADATLQRNLAERFRLIDLKHASGEEGLSPIYKGSDSGHGHGHGSSSGHGHGMKRKDSKEKEKEKGYKIPTPPFFRSRPRQWKWERVADVS